MKKILFFSTMLVFTTGYAEKLSEPPVAPAVGPTGAILDRDLYEKNKNRLRTLLAKFHESILPKLDLKQKKEWREIRNLMVENGCTDRFTLAKPLPLGGEETYRQHKNKDIEIAPLKGSDGKPVHGPE